MQVCKEEGWSFCFLFLEKVTYNLYREIVFLVGSDKCIQSCKNHILLCSCWSCVSAFETEFSVAQASLKLTTYQGWP